ncbi:hypothetical protein NECAME_07854 [Necator americanus]|uniref:Major facilitator superfamily (MFS) profile domain-containing protein n=1 Tax=Necator americanus TaxID=51031 RepID=W2TKH8_NECAM|nr:hypothetical protein NECAME_07854 [Necator americanus]ETN82600.1 hypothetical protein NECAME_07854 [Necator americanus]
MLFGTDDYCFEVKAKCYAGCPQCPDVCLNSTLLERDSCRNNYEPHFYSAAMEYEQYCKDFYRACASLQTNGRLLMTALTHGGWLAGTWRLATYYHACASLLALAVIFVLPESPLWLRRKGYHEREEKARRKLTWIKGLKYKKGKEELKKEETAQQQMLFCNVFNDAELRMVGFANAFIPWLGRRKVYIISMGSCIPASLALTVQLLFGEKGSTLYFITYLTAYNSISVSWEPNFLGAAELMPTDVRGQTTAMLNIISRLANVFASQVGTKNINLEGIGGSAKPKK